MGIELPPELADVAAQAGVVWPEADEDAMARQAQTWRDTATSMSTLATDADTTARSALSSVTGETGDAASKEWKTFVDADSGHLTSVVRDANAAADRLEHAANQVGTAKVEIVRNLVSLAQNTDAANAAASAGHPMALAGLDTAVRGTAANVAHIETQLVSAVQPGSGVDMAAVQNPVNANPGGHLLAGVTTGVADTVGQAPGAVSDVVGQGTGLVNDTVDAVRPGGVLPDRPGDLLPGRPGGVLPDPGDVLPGRPGGLLPDPGDVLPGRPGGLLPDPGDVVPGRPGDLLPGDVVPGRPGDLLPADPDITGPVPSDVIDDAPTPPTGQTVQAGFAGGLEPAAAPPQSNLPPAAAAPPLANPAAPPAYGGAPGVAPFAGAPAAPVGAPPPAAPAAPPPGRPAATFAPAAIPVDRAADPAPRAAKPMAGPPGAPPPVKGERNEVLAAFWIHMFPIGHLPVASYRPARQLPPPPPELDYAAGLRFEPADHPDFHLVDGRPRLAELNEAIAHRAATKAAAEAAPVLPPPSTPQGYAPPSAYQAQNYPGYPATAQPPAYSPQVIGAAAPPVQPIGGQVTGYPTPGQPAGYPAAYSAPGQPAAYPPPASASGQPAAYSAPAPSQPAAYAPPVPASGQPDALSPPAPGSGQPDAFSPPASASGQPAAFSPSAPASGQPDAASPAAQPAPAPQSAAQPAGASEAEVSPDAATLPRFRPINPSAGITADHPTVQALLETHDPLGGANERDWDRRYLVRLGSVTPQGISPEGLEYNWPTSEQYPEGGSAPGEAETLAENTVIDRFGSPHGRVFAADGTSFQQRSLPPAHKDGGYRRYRVTKPLPVWRAVSAAWFGQPGGGVRYRTTHTAIELVALGYLEEIA